MVPPRARKEWDVLLRARLRLAPGVILRAEETLRPGEIAPAGMAWDPATARTYVLAPWHCHFLNMVEGGFPMDEIVRVVIAFFPESAGRERIREFVLWLGEKKLAEIEWPSLESRRLPPSGKTAEGLVRPWREGGPLPLRAGLDRGNPAGQENPSGRARRRRRRFFYGIIGTVLAVALGFSAADPLRIFPREGPDSAPQEPAAKQVAPKLAEMIPIRAAAPGILTEVLVRDGDRIAKGDVVARMQDAAARETLEELRRDLGEYRVRRDDSYQAGDWEAYLKIVHTIVGLSRKIGDQEAASRPVELRSPADGEVEAEGFAGRKVGDELGGGELIVKVRADLPAEVDGPGS